MPLSKKFIAREVLIILTVIIVYFIYIGILMLLQNRYAEMHENAGIAEQVFLEDEIANFDNLTNKVNKGWGCFIIAFLGVMIIRYIFYIIKWSIKTLRNNLRPTKFKTCIGMVLGNKANGMKRHKNLTTKIDHYLAEKEITKVLFGKRIFDI